MQKIDFIYSTNLINYEFAINFMQSKVDQIIKNQGNQAIWLLEHPNIYTIGRNTEKTDIKTKINIPYIITNRGGKITYHGPGQKIIYVMMNLNNICNNEPNLKLFIKMLANWMILTLHKINISSYADMDNIGIWVQSQKINKKIASFGIRIKKWVSYHGLALNINPDMRYFKNIVPCGIDNCKMTSVFLEKNQNIKRDQLNRIIKNCFFKTFNFELDKEYKI